MNSSGEQSSLKRTSALKISEVNVVKAQILTCQRAELAQCSLEKWNRDGKNQPKPVLNPESTEETASTHGLLTRGSRVSVLGKGYCIRGG